MATGDLPTGFPQARYPWADGQGYPTRDFLYLILTLWDRTGGASGNSGGGTVSVSQSPIFFDTPDFDEPVMRGGLLAPGGWFDEKGIGGTYGFAAGTDFVAGTTTALTLSQPYGSQANLIVAFDGTWQGADQFSLSGKVLTFTSAIPAGTTKVFVKGFLSPQ